MMNRLQKKCFVACTGVHLLLVLLLVFGAGFVSSKVDTVPVETLTFIPLETTDLQVSGGGEVGVRSAPPPAPAPAPAPQAPPEPTRQPDRVRDTPKVKDEEPSLEPAKETKRKLPDVSTKVVIRKPDAGADAKAKAREDAERRAEDQRRADLARRIGSAISRTDGVFGNGLSGGTDIRLQGPGGGGVPYANFLQAVKTVYTEAWVVPDGVTDENATTTASVTIARDGTVISSRITRTSGNSAVDHSVQATLDRVRFAAPLPKTAIESQRTVSINFNVRAKLATG